VEGHDGTRWQTLSTGATIGYRKLDRISPAKVRRVRLTIEDAVETPRQVRLSLYRG